MSESTEKVFLEGFLTGRFLLDMLTETLPLFESGQLTATPAVLRLCENAAVSVRVLFLLHLRGVWGQMDQQDADSNVEAIRLGLRILSRYTVADEAVYVITEADRSVTTVLLASEY